MRPEFVNKPEMTLVGLIGCAPEVGQLDIGGLWQRYEDRHSRSIKHEVEGKGYEIHIEEETAPPHALLPGGGGGQQDRGPARRAVRQGGSCLQVRHVHPPVQKRRVRRCLQCSL